MIQAHCSKEYYDGARDALYEYAVHRPNGLEVGSTGKTYKAAVAEVDAMQEISNRCVIWRLMRDSRTDVPDFTDETGVPDWAEVAVPQARQIICYVFAALARTENLEKRHILYEAVSAHCQEMELLILGNRPVVGTPFGDAVAVSSRATFRSLMTEFLTVFAEAFRYTEEFR